MHFDTENLELGNPDFSESYGWPFTCPLITRPLSGFTKLKDACEMFEVLFNRLLRAIKQPLKIRGPRTGIGPSPQFPDVLQRYGEWVCRDFYYPSVLSPLASLYNTTQVNTRFSFPSAMLSMSTSVPLL